MSIQFKKLKAENIPLFSADDCIILSDDGSMYTNDRNGMLMSIGGSGGGGGGGSSTDGDMDNFIGHINQISSDYLQVHKALADALTAKGMLSSPEEPLSVLFARLEAFEGQPKSPLANNDNVVAIDLLPTLDQVLLADGLVFNFSDSVTY